MQDTWGFKPYKPDKYNSFALTKRLRRLEFGTIAEEYKPRSRMRLWGHKPSIKRNLDYSCNLFRDSRQAASSLVDIDNIRLQ